ncbi:MAG: UDP-3-O-(3-hydroxymyristoyl)glucosamine N-acyltransferase [Rhodospirillaceae bacterium]|nr:UDP-3-O-(3-hydroxymyristoyl)glucosamine N-acyltransferase [Rhodospirillaceae bacterium]
MPDPRFFNRTGPFRVRDIAAWTGGVVVGSCDLDITISDLAHLSKATSADLCYLAGAEYAEVAANSKCGVCLTTEELAEKAPPNAIVVVVDDPQGAFAVAAEVFYPNQPEVITDAKITVGGAFIDKTATLAGDVVVESGAVVGPGVIIGSRSRIGPGATIGAGVVIGQDCDIGSQVSLIACLLGDRIVIHPGACVGQDGFGFVFDSVAGRHRKVPQLGRVIIDDDVEIGANTTIDRGSLEDTKIGGGCRIDNQVQIGHNVSLGPRCVVVSQVGISGSCKIGSDVVLAGQVGLADHVTIGPKAQVAAKSGVMRDIAPGEAVMGYPAKPIRAFWREVAALGRLVSRKKSS